MTRNLSPIAWNAVESPHLEDRHVLWNLSLWSYCLRG